MTAPEIRNYQCEVVPGTTIFRYKLRKPGESEWRQVEITSEDSDAPVTCRFCGSRWSRRSTSNPDGEGPICVP